MNWPAIYYWTRYWIIVICSIVLAGIFWGSVGGGICRLLFGLDEETALLWVGLPIFIACIPYGVFVLPKALKKAGMI